MADEMVQKSIIIDENNSEDEDMEIGEDENLDTAEVMALSDKIDELNSALDTIEQKNDNIHAQLVELLKANRKVRQEIKEEANECMAKSEN